MGYQNTLIIDDKVDVDPRGLVLLCTLIGCVMWGQFQSNVEASLFIFTFTLYSTYFVSVDRKRLQSK